MTMTEKRVFVPNAVLIPANAVWRDSRGEHVDPERCTKLCIDGNRSYGEVYTREAWEQGGRPGYILRDDTYFVTDASGEETDEVVGSARLSITTEAHAKQDAEAATDAAEGKVRDRIELLPEMFCVKEDETEYWDEGFRKEFKIKRIFGVYIFNRRKHAHLCEITPSYERVFMGSQWEPDFPYDHPDYDRLAERIDDDIRDSDRDTEEYSYQHCSDVDLLLATEIKEGHFPPTGEAGGGYRITGLVSVTEEDAIEEIREGMCNGDL